MEPLRVPAAEAQSAAAVEVVDLASDEPLEEPAVGSLGGTAEQPLQLRSSGDAFEQPPPVPRKRVRPVVELTDGDASAKPAVVLKAQPTECTICYDPCMISGRHRLVSLRCGHLFGKKCIERWITVRSCAHSCVWSTLSNKSGRKTSDKTAASYACTFTLFRSARRVRTATSQCAKPTSGRSFPTTWRSSTTRAWKPCARSTRTRGASGFRCVLGFGLCE